jgi:hypothetical protein
MPLDSITTRRVAATSTSTDGLFPVELLDVTSSNVGRIGYDDDARRLYVQFRSKTEGTRDGTIYRYDHVPNAIFEALIQADEDDDGSVGSTFHRLVKTGGFRYTRI